MLKFRVILLLTFNNGILFRTKWFNPDYRYTSNFIDFTYADEIAAVNVTRETNVFDREFVRAKFDSFMGPFALGGHVRTLEQASYLIRECGAEKVIVNGRNLGVIESIAKKFGSQSAVASVDYEICGPALGTISRARNAEEIGAGELILNCITKDGSLEGFDIETIRACCEAVQIPVVAAGGCGKAEHMKQAYEAGATGAATGCIFHFTKASLISMKNYLADSGVPVRKVEEAA